MGWDGIVQKGRKTNEEIIQHVRSEMRGQYELFDYHMTRDAVYASFRSPLTGVTFGTVILYKNSSTELMTKWMHEDEGPLYFGCPYRMINGLSPTDNEYAKAWRQNCIKANYHKVRAGTTQQPKLF